MSETSPPSIKNGTATLQRVDPRSVYPSKFCIRVEDEIAEESLAQLQEDIDRFGQTTPGHALAVSDGSRLELLDGLRRKIACQRLGIDFLVLVHRDLPIERAIALAHSRDNQSQPASFWDRAVAWDCLVNDKVLPSEAAVAKAVGVDKATMSRALAFVNAPPEVLEAFPDIRAVTHKQWGDLAPLVHNPVTRPRLLERAVLLAGKGLSANKVAAELKAAAVGKDKIEKHEVKNANGKKLATIRPNHRGGFAIDVMDMRGVPPSYRIMDAIIIHEHFLALVESSFPTDKRGGRS